MSEIIDINIFPTTEEVALTIEPNLITITVNEFTGGGAVTSVNGETGDVVIDLSNLVPYTGATQDLNLGEFGLQTGNIEFDTTPTNVPTTVGSMNWNDTAGTLDLKLKGGAVTLQIGQETVVRVVNKTATNITLLEVNYQAVRVTGAQGQRPKVDLALANNDLNSTTTLGLVTETILNNQEGFITTSGQVQQINTTGSLQGETWADGDILYLSGTVAGRITNIKPIAPIHTVIIGFVEYAHAVNGKIFVKVDNGYELDELHNVSAVAPNNNEVLTYDTATSLWKPKTVLTALGYTPVKTVVKNTTKSTGVNAVVTTVVNSYLIPANTFSATDYFRIPSLIFTKTGTAGLYTTKIYINNVNSITSGTGGQVSSYSPTATQLFSQQSRNFFLRGGQLLGFPISIGAASDISGALPTLTAITFDPTIDNYIITTVASMTAGDLVFQESILITN